MIALLLDKVRILIIKPLSIMSDKYVPKIENLMNSIIKG